MSASAAARRARKKKPGHGAKRNDPRDAPPEDLDGDEGKEASQSPSPRLRRTDRLRPLPLDVFLPSRACAYALYVFFSRRFSQEASSFRLSLGKGLSGEAIFVFFSFFIFFLSFSSSGRGIFGKEDLFLLFFWRILSLVSSSSFCIFFL